MMNLMNFCERTKTLAIVLSLNFEKAFDKLERNEAYKAFRRFNVGEKFIKYMTILDTKMISCTINNGYWSEWFEITRGCRQGCPYSVLKFLVTVELLGIKIRANVKIKGVQTNHYEMLNSHYADDLWLALEPTEENMNAVLQELHDFESFLGLSMNYKKSVAIKLGPLRDSDAKFYTMKKLFWSDSTFKILGINMNVDWTVMHDENYDKTLDKAKAILDQWQNRNLLLIGKVTVINSLIASMFTYKLMALPSPSQSFYKRYQKTITDFIWNNGPARLKYQRLLAEKHKGGSKLIDLQAKDVALKAAWLKRWFDSGKIQSREIDWLYTNLPIKDQRIWECKITPQDINKLLPNSKHDMGMQIWRAWAEVNLSDDFDVSVFSCTPIWANSYIRVKNALIFLSKLINSNINALEDIYDIEQKKFLTYNELMEYHGPIIDLLTYCSIRSAIPVLWKAEMRHITQEQVLNQSCPNLEKLKSKNISSKAYYWRLIERNQSDTRSNKLMWETELNIIISDDRWERIQLCCLQIAEATKLRNVQYRLINRILTTNVARSRWNSGVSPACTFCKKKVETVMHLLIECESCNPLWAQLTRWLKYHCKIETTFAKDIILFNEYAGKNRSLINTLILILKQYIYAQKCYGIKPTFQGYLQKVIQWYQVEKTSTYFSGKWKYFNSKWKIYESCM